MLHLVRCGFFLLASLALLARADEPAKEEFKMSAREKEVFELINLERTKKKLRALKPNPILFKVARAHSANMGKQGKLEHKLDGKTPFQRILAAGYDYQFAGENIAYGDDSVPIKEVVEDWMKSEKHRKNIVYPGFTETGIGIVRGKKDLFYYTQVFGKLLPPKKKRN